MSHNQAKHGNKALDNRTGKFLTPFERKMLQKSLQDDLPESYRQRIQIMLLADQGNSQTKICQTLGCCPATARHWIHVACTGMAHQWQERSFGRPKTVNEEYLERLKELITHSPRDYGYPFRQWTKNWLHKHLEKEFGIKVSDRHLQRLLKQMGLSTRPKPSNDQETTEEFEKIVDNTVILGKLAAHLFADKVEPYFFQNQLDYTNVVMYEVILDDEDLAIELFYAVQEGEMSFYDVAHKYIQDTELRRKGGYRGIVRRKDLKPEISAAVFAAKPPQVLKPIVTPSEVYLIFVEEIIQPQLDKQQRQQILSELLGEWLKQQVEQVELDVALNKSKLVSDVVYNQSRSN